MKTLIKVLVAGLLFISSTSWAARPTDEINRTMRAKHKNLFIIKTEKKFLGATVEVFLMDGLLTSQNLQKRKMIIDFGDSKGGTYTIRLTKGNAQKEFHFIKK